MQPHEEEAPKGAVTTLSPTPKVKQPEPPRAQLVWLYWVRVAILDLDANKCSSSVLSVPKTLDPFNIHCLT